jgi:hypothetical protein
MAGQGGDFNGEHGAYGNAHAGLGNDGRTVDFFTAAGATGVYTDGAGSSRFNSGGGYGSYQNPQLQLNHLDLNDGEPWSEVQAYAAHLRGEEEVFPPPVRVPRGGVARSFNF